MTLPAQPTPPVTPELLYLLSADLDEFADMAEDLQPADIADALRQLPPEASAKVLGALPFDVAVRVLDEPELEYERAGMICGLPQPAAARLIDAMSADQQADLFRELEPEQRERLLPLLEPVTRQGLGLLLQYRPDSAGGMMTTEFVSVASTATAAETLALIRRVGDVKETVYAIYVTDPVTQALMHVASLRELLLVEPGTPMAHVGATRKRPDGAPPHRPGGGRAHHQQVQPAGSAGGRPRPEDPRYRHGGRRDRRAGARGRRGRAEVRRRPGVRRAVHRHEPSSR